MNHYESSTEETFLQDFLVILKLSLENLFYARREILNQANASELLEQFPRY